MASKFEVYTDKTNQYRFRLKAANGEIIATGEAYQTKAACLKGIASVQKNAPIAKIDDPEAAAEEAAKKAAAKEKAAKPKAKTAGSESGTKKPGKPKAK
jgi:uncharacterized protein YegP (UPF0339 family)